MIFKNDNFQGDIFGLKNEYKYCMEIECLYLYCRSQEVASSVAQPFAAFLSFLPFSFFPLFFFSFLRRFSSNTLFIHSIKKWGLRSITSKSDASFPMCTFLRSLMYLFLSHACPLSYTLRETYIYTHDARLPRPSFLFLFCFFLFPTRFFQTRTISSFFFYGSIHSTTVNFFFFFFASLYLPGYFVTCSSLYSSCVQFFLLFVSSWFHKFAQKLNFQRGRRRRGRPRRRKRNVGCAHSCDHGTSWSGGGDISTRYGSDTRFRASLEPSEREKRGKTGEKKKESKRARRCL